MWVSLGGRNCGFYSLKILALDQRANVYTKGRTQVSILLLWFTSNLSNVKI